jgi:hypothetical protein
VSANIGNEQRRTGFRSAAGCWKQTRQRSPCVPMPVHGPPVMKKCTDASERERGLLDAVSGSRVARSDAEG